jgi:hypothetical protein
MRIAAKTKLTTGTHVMLVVGLLVLAAQGGYAERVNLVTETYGHLLESGSFDEVARRILAAQSGDKANGEVDALGQLLSVSATRAVGVLETLAQDDSTQTATARAELLVWMARGDEMPRWKRKDRKTKPVEMSTAEAGRRAAALLDHEDPFVRALAEWAIAIRVGMENSGRTSIWPRDDVPDWYVQWRQALTPQFMLECDYVRQAVTRDAHRSSEELLASAERIVERLQGPARRIKAMGTAQQRQRLRRALARLDTARRRLNKAAATAPGDLTAQRKTWLDIRRAARQVVLSAPEFDFDQILFATRHAYHDGPNITAGAKSYIIKPGGDIYVKSGFSPGDPLRPILQNRLGPGHMRGMELWWDADRIVFAYTRQPRYFEETLLESDQGFDDKDHGLSEPMHIFEVNVDGTGLRQITDHPYNSDAEPTYLPNGDIVFVSDRSNFGSQCSGHFFQNKRIVNLYRCGPDGGGLRSLSNNKDFDRYPHVLDSGQLIFTRWEYQERHLYQTHNLWFARPDGSMTDALFKQHINSGPMALRDARHIPHSHKLVAIACGHHEYAQGAVTIVDPHRGLNETAGMRLVTPFISPREGGLGRGKPVAQGGVADAGGLYQQPFALSETGFLVAYSYHLPRSMSNANNFGLYYIDVWGNKELIHREPVLSIVYPIPLKKRPRPPAIPDVAEPKQHFAQLYVTDIYSGLPEIDRGTIKYIRISHRTQWPTIQTGEEVTDFNHYHYTPSGSWARTLGVWTWTPARVIGTVPVNDDGSAHFKAPAGIPLYFQALDENYLEVRRMRTFVTFQPGEIRGCTGCHETRDEAPSGYAGIPSAVNTEPEAPTPPSWGNRVLPDYELHIQPIIERHCASCHGGDEPDGGLEFTARKIDGYCQSYRTMFGLSPDEPTPVQEGWSYKLFYPDAPAPKRDKKALQRMERNQYPGQLVAVSDRFSDASITAPRQFGSARSPLILALLNEPVHRDEVNMSRSDWIDLVTWVDLNAPYWGSFVDKEPVRREEKPKRVFVEFPPPFKSASSKMKVSAYGSE